MLARAGQAHDVALVALTAEAVDRRYSLSVPPSRRSEPEMRGLEPDSVIMNEWNPELDKARLALPGLPPKEIGLKSLLRKSASLIFEVAFQPLGANSNTL